MLSFVAGLDFVKVVALEPETAYIQRQTREEKSPNIWLPGQRLEGSNWSVFIDTSSLNKGIEESPKKLVRKYKHGGPEGWAKESWLYFMGKEDPILMRVLSDPT